MFLNYLSKNPVYYFTWVIATIISVCLHELAHAVAAYLEGDDTAKESGYFTLNPVKHMGIQSLIMLFIIGLAWGSCPVRPERFKHKKLGDAIVSFAGPLTNAVLAVIFAILLVFLKVSSLSILPSSVEDVLTVFFSNGCMVNIALFMLNIIPIPPLDGAKVLEYFVPSVGKLYEKIGGYGFMIIFVLLWMPGVSDFYWDTALRIAKFIISLIRIIF